MSRRFGADNKLLAQIDHVPLVRRVTRAMVQSRADSVVVVLGHDGSSVRSALDGLPVDFVENPDFESGISMSLRAGLNAPALNDVDAAVVGLADMPWIESTHVNALIDAFDPDSESTVCVPIHDGRPGNPVLWSSVHFGSLVALDGDVGGKVLLERLPEAISYVPVSDASIHLDVDTPTGLDNHRRRPMG